MKNDSYIQNRYIETYENIQQRDHEREMLPGNIQKDIEKVTNNPEVKKLAGEFKLNREGGKDNGPKSAVAKKENH